MPEVTAKFDFLPRPYQVPFFQAMIDRKIKRAMLEWPRKAGKEMSCINWMTLACQERIGYYPYYFPDKPMARLIAWEGSDKEGRPLLDYIPQGLLKYGSQGRNKTEMKLYFKNGSIIHFDGTNDPEFTVGPNPVGCVFSEWSLMKENLWQQVMPPILQNKGWAVFNFTPKQRGPHAETMLHKYESDPEWFCQKLTHHELIAPDGSWYIPEKMIDQARRDGMSEAMIQSEFHCNADVPAEGSVYEQCIYKAIEDNRIRYVPHDARLNVFTGWDLGYGDATAIWFYQMVGTEVRFIKYLEMKGKGLPYWCKRVLEMDYNYERHKGPHDLAVHDLSDHAGESRLQVASRLGVRFDIIPRSAPRDRVETVRANFSRFYFDKVQCAEGLKMLGRYEGEMTPEHDPSRHAADALGIIAQSLPRTAAFGKQKPVEALSQFDPLTHGEVLAQRERVAAVSDFNPYEGR